MNHAGFAGGSVSRDDGVRARQSRLSQEDRERAVRMVVEYRPEYGSAWEAIRLIAEKLGCSAEALRTRVGRTQVDAGEKSGMISGERARMKDLEREVRDFRHVSEILRKGSARFGQAEIGR